MPPLAKNVLHQPGIETLRQWIWSLPANTLAVSLGHSIDPLPNYDAWWHTMIVDEAQTYTNTTGSALDLRIANFRFQVTRTDGGEVTPFLVKVLGDDDFIVVAVGTPRTDLEYRLGANVFPFHDGGDVVITLQAGETLATGFLDAQPDGSGGGEAGVIPYCSCNGTNEVWSTGGPTPADSGKVTVGRPPTPGAMTVTGNRMYSFAIDLCGCPPPPRLRLGNDTDEQISEDTWSSNLVINETDTHTNGGWLPQQFAIESFAFHARRLGDPVTPFVVRIDGDGEFTVLAIGTTRTSAQYVLGANRFAFDADGPVALTLAPGDTIASGFIDAAPDGSGGGAGAVVPFALGGDAVWHTGGPAGTDSGSLVVGQPPQPGTSGPQTQARDYAFGVGLRSGADGTALTIGKATHTGPLQLDPWEALTVISRTGSYTNTSAAPQRIDVNRFRFRVASPGGGSAVGPVTPFVVKVRGHSDFLVVAIGTTRDERDYGEGDNDLPFREGGNAEIVLGPGERLAPGFISARPDGSGTRACVIPFVEGGSSWLTGGAEASDTGRIRYGWAPQPGKVVLAGSRNTGANGFDTFGLAVLRDYCFEIELDLRP